jgi:hypothetical protein
MAERTPLPTPEFRRTPMESFQAKRRLVHELEKRSWIRYYFLNGSLTS